jgi:ABC-type glycerol-3-phosphate transport system substrate-binding protein
MMKKIIGLIVCVTLIMSMAACGDTSETNSTQSDTSNDDSASADTEKEPVEQIELNEDELSGTFTYWSAFSGDSMEWDKGRIAAFEEMYPNITVDAQFVTDSAGINNGKLLAAIAGGNAPDLIIADDYSSAYAYAAQGSFESWEPYMETLELEIDDFITGYKDIINYEGTPYLIPQDGNALLLYYSPEAFEEVGLDPDSPPTTLEELDEYAELLTKQNAEGTYERFGFIPWLDQGNESFTWPFFFGSDIYDVETGQLTLTDDNVVESFQWMAKYAEKYDPEKIQSFVSGAGGMFSPDHPFMKGSVAMTITGNWFANALKIYAPDVNYRVAPIPVPEYGRKNSTTLGANVFAIPRGADNADLAALFVKYCLRAEVNATNFDVWRSVPTIDASFDEVSWTIAGDEMYALQRELINSPDSGLPALTSVSAQLNVDLKTLRDDVIYNGKDPLPLLEELQERLQAEIDE